LLARHHLLLQAPFSLRLSMVPSMIPPFSS
jgi:hypothetical protein